MKAIKMILTLTLILTLTVTCASAQVVERLGEILTIDQDWVMTIITQDGNLWLCEVQDEWYEGDSCRVIFDNMDTPDPEDDKIIFVLCAK